MAPEPISEPSAPAPGPHADHERLLAECTVVVVTGGDPPLPEVVLPVLAGVPERAAVVAADSGVEHALRLGLPVHHAVGDFDSVERAVLAGVEARGARLVRHPAAKSATDMELALDTAVELGALRVVVIGGHGGRLDHFLANCLVLAAPRYANLVVDAVIGEARVHVARPWAPTSLVGEPGDLVTLLPVHGPAEGVSTEGLLYPLRLEPLLEGSTRGVSNEMAATRAEVRLTAGGLLVIQPGDKGTHLASGLGPPEPDRTPNP